jgi:hypothetical protein
MKHEEYSLLNGTLIIKNSIYKKKYSLYPVMETNDFMVCFCKKYRWNIFKSYIMSDITQGHVFSLAVQHYQGVDVRQMDYDVLDNYLYNDHDKNRFIIVVKFYEDNTYNILSKEESKDFVDAIKVQKKLK